MNKKINDDLPMRVMDVIARTQKIPRENIKLDTLLEELGIDSFDSINILFALEDEFDISLPNEKKDLRTIHDLVLDLQNFLDKQIITDYL